MDVGDRQAGDKITAGDIKLGDGIKASADENEILAVVIAAKVEAEADE